MAPRRRMVDPDYAGQIRAGIGAKMNGQMTSSNSFKAFQTPMGGGYTKEEGEKFQKNRLDLLFPDAGPSSVTRNVDKAGRAFFDFSGIGTNPQGNFGVDPLTLALTLTGIGPISKLIGGIGKVAKAGSLARRVLPAAVRYSASASNVVGRAARTGRQARLAVEEAGSALERARETANAGYKLAVNPLRTESLRYADRGVDAFDKQLGTDLVDLVSHGTSRSHADELVRLGEATVTYNSRGDKIYRNLRGQRLFDEGTAAATAASNARTAAEATLRRSEKITDYLGTSGVSSELKRRVKNLNEARARIARNPGAGAPKPPTTVY